MNGCRIGKIKMKNGGAEIRVLPSSQEKIMRIDLGWGEVIIREYGRDRLLTGRDALWMIEAARNILIWGD